MKKIEVIAGGRRTLVDISLRPGYPGKATEGLRTYLNHIDGVAYAVRNQRTWDGDKPWWEIKFDDGTDEAHEQAFEAVRHYFYVHGFEVADAALTKGPRTLSLTGTLGLVITILLVSLSILLLAVNAWAGGGMAVAAIVWLILLSRMASPSSVLRE